MEDIQDKNLIYEETFLHNYIPCTSCECPVRVTIDRPYRYCKVAAVFNPNSKFCNAIKRKNRNKSMFDILQDFLPE